MPKNSPSVRTTGAVVARALPTTLGAGTAVGSGAWAGHAVAGVVVAVVIVAGQVAAAVSPIMPPALAASLIALFRKDGKDATKRIEALTGLIDKLR